MGVRVVFLEGEKTPIPKKILLPQRALRDLDRSTARATVFVFSEGRVQERQVELVDASSKEEWLEVRSGVRGGVLLVLEPPLTLSDGDAIEVTSGS